MGQWWSPETFCVAPKHDMKYTPYILIICKQCLAVFCSYRTYAHCGLIVTAVYKFCTSLETAQSWLEAGRTQMFFVLSMTKLEFHE